jgi:hypothetical protein
VHLKDSLWRPYSKIRLNLGTILDTTAVFSPILHVKLIDLIEYSNFIGGGISAFTTIASDIAETPKDQKGLVKEFQNLSISYGIYVHYIQDQIRKDGDAFERQFSKKFEEKMKRAVQNRHNFRHNHLF